MHTAARGGSCATGGASRRSAEAEGRVDARPVFWTDPNGQQGVEGAQYILVGDDGGVLHGLSVYGDRRWSYRTRAEIDGTVTVSDGRAFVMDGADVLHAVDARTGKFRDPLFPAGEFP